MTKVDEAFELISAMSILEARDLVKKIEEEFGVTAAAPIAVAAASGGGESARSAMVCISGDVRRRLPDADARADVDTYTNAVAYA